MKKGFYTRVVGVFCALNLFLFILYYLSGYVFSGDFILYAYTFTSELLLAAMPLISAALISYLYRDGGSRAVLIHAIALSAVGILYNFPLSAFEYAYAGYVIGEVLLLSALTSILSAVAAYIEIILLSIIIIFVSRSFARRRGIAAEGAILPSQSAFDLSVPFNVGVFVGALVLFIYRLVLEIYDTVVFILDSEGFMTAGEIVYIVIRYIFSLAILLASQLAATALAKRCAG